MNHKHNTINTRDCGLSSFSQSHVEPLLQLYLISRWKLWSWGRDCTSHGSRRCEGHPHKPQGRGWPEGCSRLASLRREGQILCLAEFLKSCTCSGTCSACSVFQFHQLGTCTPLMLPSSYCCSAHKSACLHLSVTLQSWNLPARFWFNSALCPSAGPN